VTLEKLEPTHVNLSNLRSKWHDHDKRI
jgi:hypothetical protein